MKSGFTGNPGHPKTYRQNVSSRGREADDAIAQLGSNGKIASDAAHPRNDTMAILKPKAEGNGRLSF
jgi:hypothetical protein